MEGQMIEGQMSEGHVTDIQPSNQRFLSSQSEIDKGFQIKPPAKRPHLNSHSTKIVFSVNLMKPCCLHTRCIRERTYTCEQDDFNEDFLTHYSYFFCFRLISA